MRLIAWNAPVLYEYDMRYVCDCIRVRSLYAPSGDDDDDDDANAADNNT